MTLKFVEFPKTCFSNRRRSAIRTLAIVCMISLCAVSSAQTRTASTVVVMKSFSFEPARIELRAGAPLVLHLENQSSSGHSFVAPAFFAAAQVVPSSVRLLRDGRVEVPSHQTIELALVPSAGTYPLKCGHPFHAALGMRGVIVVR